MAERFESTTLRALQLGFLGGALVLFACAVVVPMFTDVPGYYSVLLVALGVLDLVWMRMLVRRRYELSPDGLRVKQGPFGGKHPWSSLGAVRPTRDRQTWARGLAFARSEGDDVFVHPADPAGFLASVRRYAPHIEITPEAEAFARGSGGA